MSVSDTFTTLTRGGCVCIPSEEERMNDPGAAIKRTNANWVCLTPTVAGLFAPTQAPSLRTMVLGGEASTKAIIQKWAPALDLIIAYGPAETSINCLGNLPAKPTNHPGDLGHPIGGRLWICDIEDCNRGLVPIGCVGELLVEGRILARGYLNDKSKTDAAFIKNPPWAEKQSGSSRRFYKTGDLVRYNPDGTIHYIRRKDTQIKLQGQRIELGEVIFHIRNQYHKAQEVAVEVVLRGNAATLVAFIALGEDADKDSENLVMPLASTLLSELLQLYGRITELLPSYMVPALWIPMRRMPLNMSGKLDRNKLRELFNGFSPAELEQYSLANVAKPMPSSAMERKLQALWTEVLGTDSIGADDSFFRLGGDSIGAMRLAALAQGQGISLSVAQIFQSPQLIKMAEIADQSVGLLDLNLHLEPFSLVSKEDAVGPLHKIIGDAASQCQVRQEDIEDIYPCTPLQEGLVLLSTRQEGAYVIKMAFRLPSDLDIERFKEAWQKVVELNSILRTRVIYSKSGSLQVVLREKISWETGTTLQEYLKSGCALTVSNGTKLTKFALIESSADTHFVWIAHHAAYDGWSIRVIFEQVEKIYSSRQLPTPTPFNHFIHYLQNADNGAAENYWKSEFAGDNEAPDFPTLPDSSYEPRPDRTETLKMALPQDVDSNNMLTTILRASWSILLAKYVDSDSVIFGVPLSGRFAALRGISEMSGPTLTTVPVKVHLDWTQSIATFLEVLYKQAVDMIPFEHTGLQNIRRIVGDDSVNVRNLFTIQPAMEAMAERELLGLTAVSIDNTAFGSYALAMECSLSDEGTVEAQIKYDSHVISASQITNMLHQFEHVTRQLLEGSLSGVTLKEIEMITPREHQRLMDLNKFLPETVNNCVHELISQRTIEQAESPAICGWDGKFSYREFDGISTIIAHHLVSLGAGPDVFVACCFENSAWAIVSMLAVLKSGAAFVFVDASNHSKSRRDGILQATKTNIIMCAPQYLHLFNTSHVLPICRSFAENVVVEPTSPVVDPTNAAFATFSPDATVKPDGVVTEHSAIVSSAMALSDSVLVRKRSSRVLQLSSYTSSLCVSDILISLICGSCICIPTAAEGNLAAAMRDMEVNWARIPPAVARILQPSDVPGLKTLVLNKDGVTKEILKAWIDAADVVISYESTECPVTIGCDLAYRYFFDLLVSLPKQSEFTVNRIALVCPSNFPLLFASFWRAFLSALNFKFIHIGRRLTLRTSSTSWNPSDLGSPIGCVFWVLDTTDSNILAPFGCVGELCIDGPVLPRGYVNRELADGSFIEAPSWLEGAASGRLLYKTGDLVRYNPNGTLCYVGRKDSQVKLHGRRIETALVETHVINLFSEAKHMTVDVVSYGANSTGSKPKLALAVFMTLGEYYDEQADDLELFVGPPDRLKIQFLELQVSLTEKLQSYMVPSLFIVLKRMPLDARGNFDYVKLRQVVSSLSDLQVADLLIANTIKRTPSTDMEYLLQSLWADVLGIETKSIGADDSFFKLGGDSVTAMHLVAACRSHDLSLTVVDIFKHPHLSKMSNAIQASADPSPSNLELPPFSLLHGQQATLTEQAAIQCQIQNDEIEDIYPCTPLQEGLMLLSSQQQGAYLAQMSFRLPVNLNVERFQEAWMTLFDMHPILRTRIVQLRGCFQVVVRERISWNTGTSLEDYLVADIKQEVSYGTQLTRYAIIQDSTDIRYFVFTAQHAVYDGLSAGMLFEQAGQLYAGSSIRKPVPFSRFIQYLGSISSTDTERFWSSQLSGEKPSSFPQLPSSADDPYPDQILSHSLELSRPKSDITVPTILRAAWAFVNAQYSDNNDVIFGASVSGRNAPVAGITEMSGPTITTVPVRIRLDPGQTIKTFLRNVQAQAVDMIPFEHTGLQNIRRMMGNNLQVKFDPLDIKNVFVVQPSAESLGESNLLGLSAVSANPRAFGTYALSMSCSLSDDGSKVDLQAQFDENIIGAAQVQLLMHQLERVLRQLVQESDTDTLGVIDMFSSEDERLVMSWNEKMPSSINACVHDLIHEQVVSQPNVQAICAWDGDFTYSELDELSLYLANYLFTEFGIRPGTMVPICFDKSRWTIVAMLGVLRAGAAYISLLPTYPTNRMKAIIDNSKARLILAAPQHTHLVEGFVQDVVAIQPSLFESIPHYFIHKLPKVQPNNAAFVVYTSGTTGNPKGVIIEHSAFCTSSNAFGTRMGIGPSSRVFNFSSYAWDASISDIFASLTRGGCVCIPSEQERTDDLAGTMSRMKTNLAILTPSVAGLLWPEDIPSLKTLVLGGETAPAPLIQRWTGSGKVQVMIGYGMAECTVTCCQNDFVSPTTNPANIGRPMGALLWICDASDQNRLTPVGCVGELLIEGPILARGYLNGEKMTNRAFVRSPSWLRWDSKRRFYKTGDLVRYNTDGTISYVGRKDTQVKFHGQRLELGDVEHHIQIQEGVKISMALLGKSGHCNGQLVAIVALQDFSNQSSPGADVGMTLIDEKDYRAASLQASRLRQYLINQLPEYMVPTVWVLVDSLPLSRSGKIDRMKAVKFVEEMDETTYGRVMDANSQGELPERPLTDLERRLQLVWSNVLNIPVEQVLPNKSFLRLGGDSISAMQVVSLCRSDGIVVTVPDILRTNSILALAERAKLGFKASTISRVETLDTPFELSPVQQLYFDQNNGLAFRHEFDQHTRLSVTRHVEADAVGAAIKVIVNRHSMLRARFVPPHDQTERWTQVIAKETVGSYSFEASEENGRESIQALELACQKSLNIEKGPVFAIRLFNLIETREQILFVTAHHLVVDLVSWRIILRDLELLLEGRRDFAEDEKPFSFQTWCQLQEEHTRRHVMPRNTLPFDVAPADFKYWGIDSSINTQANQVEEHYTIPVGITDMLFGSANDKLRTQPIDIILAALMHSFRQTFDDRHPPAIFNEGHGRDPWTDEIDLSETVGWFTTMIPLSIPMDNWAKNDIVQTLRLTKDIRRSIPNNGQPYFASRFLNPDGQALYGHHSQMEILFNYAGRFQQLEQADTLLRLDTIAKEGVDSAASHFGGGFIRPAIFQISANVVDDSALISMTFSRQIHHQDRIRQWLRTSKDVLEQCVRDLVQMQADVTLSDFPLLSITYAGLEDLKHRLLQMGILSLDELEDAYHCSPMQQGILLSQIRNPELYMINITSELVSANPQADPIDVRKLENAWQQVVQRHSSLRTIFTEAATQDGGLLIQVVLKIYRPSLVMIECEDSNAFEKLRNHPPPELSTSRPLHQFVVAQSRSSGRIFCKIELSHALTDATSTELLMRDFILAYGNNLPAGNAPLYSDYIKYLQTKPIDEGINHWKQYLLNAQHCIFPTMQDARQMSQENLHKSIQIEMNEIPTLRHVCSEHGLTVANVLQTAWSLVLRYYTGSDDICFGYLTSGRDAPISSIDETTGLFINMLISRIAINGENSVMSIMKTMQENFLQSLPYQHCSLAEIQHTLGLSGKQLFNTSLSYRTEVVQSQIQTSGQAPAIVSQDYRGEDPTEVSVSTNDFQACLTRNNSMTSLSTLRQVIKT